MAHFEVEMTDTRTGRHPRPCLGFLLSRSEEIIKVNRRIVHSHHATVCPWPFTSWPVAIEFQPITIWIVQVKGFTHEVI